MTAQTINDIYFLGDSLDIIRQFPKDTKNEIGYQLDILQKGLMPKDWKPMQSIGVGVKEIRIRNKWGSFRTIYVIKSKQGIMVLHAFEKKTLKTPKKDIDLAKDRFKQIKL